MLPILSLVILEERKRTINVIKSPERMKAFDLPENEFISNFRVNKEIFAELIERLRPALEPRSYRRNVISVEAKVLCALRFFAGGLYQKCVAKDIINSTMSQQSVSNCIRVVTNAINNLMFEELVQFPVLNSDIHQVKEEFFHYSGFPGVIGAIDCMHVAVVPPPDDGVHNERNYVNQKGFHSINVQLVCDVQMRILSVCARFPGCTHDGYIWKMSSLRDWFLKNSTALKNTWLLGDSGYPLEPFLMTPNDGSSNLDQKYNVAHKKGHSVIERCNGVLKSRFRCLLRHQTLNYKPTFAASIINACVVLHNMCLTKGLQLSEEEIEADELFDTGCSNESTEHAENIRNRLISILDF